MHNLYTSLILLMMLLIVLFHGPVLSHQPAKNNLEVAQYQTTNCCDTLPRTAVKKKPCNYKLPEGVLVRQMKDNTWIIFEGIEEDGHYLISYYFSPTSSTGWYWTSGLEGHYKDSCAAKLAFKTKMDSITFK